jgi:uncharacterized protein YjbJ (UPF0337 family)
MSARLPARPVRDATANGVEEGGQRNKENDMGDGTVDDLKGRTKEAAGDLSGDKDLKNEGKVDRASGTVKDKVGDAGDKLKDTIKRD